MSNTQTNFVNSILNTARGYKIMANFEWDAAELEAALNEYAANNSTLSFEDWAVEFYAQDDQEQFLQLFV